MSHPSGLTSADQTVLLKKTCPEIWAKLVKAFNRNKIIGESPEMLACFDQMTHAANTDANILINGETGTGKELFARAIHDNSPRSQKSFVVDCAALPETLIESVLFGYEKGAFTGANRSREGLVNFLQFHQ